MNETKKSKLRAILVDIAGVICLILVPIFGWLPGPGGIPLLLAGLGLLSTNHEWARNLLHQLKIHSNSLRKIFFPNEPWIMWGWDIFGIIALASGIYINIASTSFIVQAISYILILGSIYVFLLNRNRIGKLDRIIRRKKQ